MATPIVEQIAQKVQQRLGLISTASGYETTASEVVRPSRKDSFSPKDYQLSFAQESKTENTGLSCPGNPPLQAWNQPFRIAAQLLQSKLDKRAIDSLRNEFEADVIKALSVAESGYWKQWDGLAINSRIDAVETYLDVADELAGFHVILTVIYRTPEDDPYTVVG